MTDDEGNWADYQHDERMAEESDEAREERHRRLDEGMKRGKKMSNIDRIRKYYGTMDAGEKQYMANKLFKDDKVVAAKVKGFIPEDVLSPPEPKTYEIGQVFRRGKLGEQYLLAQTGWSKVSLISMVNGNRVNEAVVVDDVRKITVQEMRRIGGANFHRVV